MILGYVISDERITDRREYISYVSRMEDADASLPRLVVGYSKAKSCIPGLYVLEKKVSDTLFWTLGRTERRTDHERDLKAFYAYVISYLISDVKYYYTNIFKINLSQSKKIVSMLFSASPKTIYINKGMVYIHAYGEAYVLGFSIPVLEFVGIKAGRVIDRLKHLPQCRVLEEGDKLVSDLSLGISGNEYAIPYIVDKI